VSERKKIADFLREQARERSGDDYRVTCELLSKLDSHHAFDEFLRTMLDAFALAHDKDPRRVTGLDEEGDDQVLGRPEICKLLGISTKTFDRDRKRGLIGEPDRIRPVSGWRRSAVLAYAHKRQQGPDLPPAPAVLAHPSKSSTSARSRTTTAPVARKGGKLRRSNEATDSGIPTPRSPKRAA